MTGKRLLFTMIGIGVSAAALLVRGAMGSRALDARAALDAAALDYPGLRETAASFLLAPPSLTPRDKALAALGRRLFFDPRLSRNGQVSCATCHQPARSFTDGLPLAKGLGPTRRNTPTLVNVFAGYWFFWDGRADSLAAQSFGPLEAEEEHGITRAQALRHVLTTYGDEYEALFGAMPPGFVAALPPSARPPAPAITLGDGIVTRALTSLGDAATLKRLAADARRTSLGITEVFRREVLARAPDTHPEDTAAYEAMDPELRAAMNRAFANVGLALEAYQRGLLANASPFDAFARAWQASGRDDPAPHFTASFGPTEFLGFTLFVGKAKCALCHAGGTFSDNQFHNIALPYAGGPLALGRTLGIRLVAQDAFNCRGPYLARAGRDASESCRDLPFLDPDTPEGLGSFKTPTLRNVAQTAPYMHDGRFATLRDVLRHYNAMDALPAVGFREESLRPLSLGERERQALEAFLVSLSSPVRDLTAPESGQ